MTSAENLYELAQQYFPGGVTATARANPAIGRPFYVARGDGAYVYDLDGRASRTAPRCSAITTRASAPPWPMRLS